jgi:hypothetical protein
VFAVNVIVATVAWFVVGLLMRWPPSDPLF